MELLDLDQSYSGCLEQHELLIAEVSELQAAVDSLTGAAKLQQESLDRCEADRTRLFDLWSDENLARHQAEETPHWGSCAGWATAGVMTAATAVLAGVLLAQ